MKANSSPRTQCCTPGCRRSKTPPVNRLGPAVRGERGSPMFGKTRRMSSRVGRLALAVAACGAISSVLTSERLAQADVTHVVARGHTVEAIAHRYHVTVKSILDKNHLTD